MSVDVDLLLGVSGHSHANPRLAGLSHDGSGRHAFPAGWALIRHPVHGDILFDCGYGEEARRAMRRGLRRVYRHLLGACCPPAGDAAQLLARHGIAPHGIRHVVLSHFHPDHIGGLAAFGAARFYAHTDAWRQARRGWLSRLHSQIWPELFPGDFDARLHLLEPAAFLPADDDIAVLGHCADLLGDGSVRAFELPGHAAGQIGLALRVRGERVLLVADACWQREQIDTVRTLPWLARVLATHHAARYAATLARLHRFRTDHPTAWVIPSHCAATLRAWTERNPGDVLRYEPDTRMAAASP